MRKFSTMAYKLALLKDEISAIDGGNADSNAYLHDAAYFVESAILSLENAGRSFETGATGVPWATEGEPDENVPYAVDDGTGIRCAVYRNGRWLDLGTSTFMDNVFAWQKLGRHL